MPGNYIDFHSLDDDFEVNVNDCSSGFTYAELQPYDVISEGDEIELRAYFVLSDNTQEETDITLVKNEYSCFDGYSVVKFDAEDLNIQRKGVLLFYWNLGRDIILTEN